MPKKKPLTCQSKKVCIVIRKNKEIPLSRIKEYCTTYFDRYAFIEHKGDIEPVSGLVEGVHYHICGDFRDSKIPFSTRLNTMCDFFKFENAHGIEIDQYVTFEGALQYLTHKNAPEKTPHEISEIVTNLSEEDFKIFYDATIGNVITFDLVYTACCNANNIIDVIREIGIGNYRVWRAVIMDIWHTMSNSSQSSIYKKHIDFEKQILDQRPKKLPKS